jgi:5S rRNA maturation endonuclease (ribonuclease M5)
MSQALYLVVAESAIGVHSKVPHEVFKMYAISFLVHIEHQENPERYIAKNTMKSSQVFHDILLDYNKGVETYDEVYILLSQDLDVQGEIMAEAFRQFLTDEGVPASAILRTPLTQEGYIAVVPFVNLEKYKKFLFLQQEFTNMLKKKKSGVIAGFRKILALKYLSSSKGKQFRIDMPHINLDGTSTTTFVSKSLGIDS